MAYPEFSDPVYVPGAAHREVQVHWPAVADVNHYEVTTPVWLTTTDEGCVFLGLRAGTDYVITVKAIAANDAVLKTVTQRFTAPAEGASLTVNLAWPA